MNEEKGPDKRVKQLPNVRYEVITVVMDIEWDLVCDSLIKMV